MAEYSREQKSRISRIAVNNGRGGQLKNFVDGRMNSISQNSPILIQRKPGLLGCTTTIEYNDGGLKSTGPVFGENDVSKKTTVLQTIGSHRQTKWIAAYPKKGSGNEPGVCAEPNSLAEALLKVKNSPITCINQTPARFIHEKTLRGHSYSKGDIYPPCETCEQWVPKLSGIGDNRTDFVDVAD